jgi:cytochrome b pre-mRNA-processing protein 3
MLSRFFSRNRRDHDSAASLYGAIVAQARTPALYADIGVPDSVGGRFEMLMLHVIILSRRLETGDAASRAVGQAVFDLFCGDMDNALRELGIGDLSVPKHMRRVGEAYFGRTASYGPGFSERDGAVLAEAIERTVFGGSGPTVSSRRLAEYALAAVRRLEAQREQAIIADGPDFPDVTSFGDGGEGQ